MSRITILCLAITLSGLTLDGRGAEKVVSTWPGFRGNGDSHSAASRLPVTWELRGRRAGSWTIRLPGYGQSSPVVWGEMVFVTAVSGDEKEHLHVLAISLQDGKTLWKKDFAATQRVPDGDAVSRGAPTPVVDAERLYAVFESGDAIALSHAGDMLWQRSFVKDYGDIKGPHGYSSSPVLAGDSLVLQVAHAGPSYLLALDKATGKNRWKVDHPSQTGWSTPTVFRDDGIVGVIASTAGSVRAYDLHDGRELWFVTGVQGNSTASPTVVGNQVLIAASADREGGGSRSRGGSARGDGQPPMPGGGRPASDPAQAGSLAIRLGGSGDVTASHISWKAAKVSAGYASPVVAEGLAYFVNRVGGVQCVDIATGEVRWQHRLPGSAWASPVLVDGNVFFFCKDGAVVVLKAGPNLEEVGESTLSATDVVYGVAAVEGAWLVRTGRGLVKIAAE